jgi:polyphosphate kinase
MDKTCYTNRELSWLKFNERVLAEAGRKEVPLCERLNFAAIYQSNLDEFFMVRVGSLMDQNLISTTWRDSKSNLTAAEQIDKISADVARLNVKKGQVYDNLMQELEKYNIHLVRFQKLSPEHGKKLEKWFDKEMLPLLTPMVVTRRQPFPFLQNNEIYAVGILQTKKGNTRMGIIPCATKVFPRLIPVDGTEGTYMLLEEVILHFMSKVFHNNKILTKSLIRLTRSADIDADALYDEDDDYREFMEKIIRRRKRLSPVRLELTRPLDDAIVKNLCTFSGMTLKCIYYSPTPLDISFLRSFSDNLRAHTDLFYEKRFPQHAAMFELNQPILPQIREKDRLLSYPFESMKSFLDFLQEAAVDPDVLSIKITLYRVSRQSKVVESLIEAAENGKNVLVLVELKARFDEENNIEWSRRLEDAGAQVIYGLDGYKVHSKLCLITRRTRTGIEYFTQIGTGNYNEQTARLYTDLALFTARREIGVEASAIFQALSIGDLVHESQYLLVAPECMQNRIVAMIDEEIAYAKSGRKGYIGIKINSLTDKVVMDELVKASQAGVRIELVVRGICCLIPGLPGLTENIHVRSIVGRFLEHSRIYIFGQRRRQRVYIASADLMTRNMTRRVEVGAPVLDPDIKRRLVRMFNLMLKDNQQAWQLDNKGQYHRAGAEGRRPFNSQEYFYREAYRMARRLTKK